MSTTFLLKPGYNSGFGCNATSVDNIIEVCKSISMDDIKEKALEYGAPLVDSEDVDLDEYIKKYESLPSDDLTCYFEDDGVYQVASGGDDFRTIKEIVRRAFAMLVLEECYKRKYSVSFIIG
jgi:hypothetical protein